MSFPEKHEIDWSIENAPRGFEREGSSSLFSTPISNMLSDVIDHELSPHVSRMSLNKKLTLSKDSSYLNYFEREVKVASGPEVIISESDSASESPEEHPEIDSFSEEEVKVFVNVKIDGLRGKKKPVVLIPIVSVNTGTFESRSHPKFDSFSEKEIKVYVIVEINGLRGKKEPEIFSIER